MKIKLIFTYLLIYIGTVFYSYAESVEKGFKYLNKNKIEKAQEVFDRYYKKDSKDILANYGLFLLLKKNKVYEKSYPYIFLAEQQLRKKKGGEIITNDVSITTKQLQKEREDVETEILRSVTDEDDLDKMIAYLKKYPNAHNIKSAINQRNELAFQKARELHTIKEYNYFLTTYLEAEQHSEIENLRNQLIFKFVTDTNKVESYELFMKMYPTSKEVYQATKNRDKLVFQEVLKKNSIEAFIEFIQKYPNAEQVEQAKKFRLDINHIESLYDEKDKQKHVIEETQEKVEQKNDELKVQQTQTLFYTVLSIIVAILLIIAIFAYVGMRKAHKKISEQKEVIEESQKEILQKNKEIVDSINYAKFIQTAILPSTKRIKNHFKDAFVFYCPKDIVSGDFYWYGEVDGKKIIAAVDCTGHGVPGAFMSMIGNTLLNQIVLRDKITKPNEILFNLRQEVIKALSQSNIEEDVKNDTRKDGMDIALCVIEKNKIEFSGAFNPMILIKKGEGFQVKADRMPIGDYLDKNNQPFQNHIYDIEKGDVVYLFTDGYPDQFGGDHDKKIGSKVFREMLIEISVQSAEQQEKHLERYIKTWMGTTPQIDDMLIIGMKF